ncbi:hypothetical protein GCM10010344_18930 [Streptomyces bluensis]|nr:hypothetical protein GCM10010344_18930 [Streptomyces bluensis]
MAAATARRTSDACIVARPLSLERCYNSAATARCHERSKRCGPRTIPSCRRRPVVRHGTAGSVASVTVARRAASTLAQAR